VGPRVLGLERVQASGLQLAVGAAQHASPPLSTPSDRPMYLITTPHYHDTQTNHTMRLLAELCVSSHSLGYLQYDKYAKYALAVCARARDLRFVIIAHLTAHSERVLATP
jgi:hypothetical protein